MMREREELMLRKEKSDGIDCGGDDDEGDEGGDGHYLKVGGGHNKWCGAFFRQPSAEVLPTFSFVC